MNKVRIDKYLWAIRLYKTRTKATTACNSRKVKINGQAVKPSYMLEVGEEIHVRINYANRVFKALKLIEKRVGASIAAECCEDLTPPEEMPEFKQASFYTPEKRERGAGRPTKQERRKIEDLKNEMEKDEWDW